MGSFTLKTILNAKIFSNIKLDGIGGVCKTLKVNELSKNLLEALAENNRLVPGGSIYPLLCYDSSLN